MADSTNKSGSWYDWASLIASIYGDRKDRERQGDSKPIPMSPEERRVYDEQWNQYRYSPARHFTNETAFQALQGMDPNAYKFNPQSEYFKGTGFKLPEIPKIDWSQVPKYWRDIYQTGKPFKPSAPGDPKTPPIGGTYGPGTNNAGQGGGGGFRRGDGLGGPMQRTGLPDPSDSGGRPAYGESIYDFYSRNPGGNANYWLPNGGRGAYQNPNGTWTTSDGDVIGTGRPLPPVGGVPDEDTDPLPPGRQLGDIMNPPSDAVVNGQPNRSSIWGWLDRIILSGGWDAVQRAIAGLGGLGGGAVALGMEWLENRRERNQQLFPNRGGGNSGGNGAIPGSITGSPGANGALGG
jgi:hypothetical protein